jgi:flavin reductase (DIM6/NTAB) family NADH-FMN oxidoreductase RutF
VNPLAAIPLAVTIVAAASGDRRSCATSTAMYVRLDPPTVAIGEHAGSTTARLIRESGQFSLSVLSDGQRDLAERAGRKGTTRDKLDELGIPLVPPPASLSAPGVAGSLAVLWCRLVAAHEHGEDLLLVGEVVEHRTGDEQGEPLLRHRRRYRAGGPWLSGEAPEGYPL